MKLTISHVQIVKLQQQKLIQKEHWNFLFKPLTIQPKKNTISNFGSITNQR